MNNADENFFVDKVLKGITDIIIVVMVALFFLNVLCEKTTVVGNSMSPTLKDEESILINKLSYEFGGPDRYDIVVFKVKTDDETKYYVKRVVGLPGDSVQIKSGRIYVNDKELKYNEDVDDIVTPGLASHEIVLDEDEYFVIGDNWNNSEDSRFSQIGNINKKAIVGKAWLHFTSIKNIKIIK
jgi:signal peptidase I